MLTHQLTKRLNQTPNSQTTHAILTGIDEEITKHYHCKIQEGPGIAGETPHNFTLTIGHKTNRAHHQHNKLETQLTIHDGQITTNHNTKQTQTVDLTHPNSLQTITNHILQKAKEWQNQTFTQQQNP